MGVRIEFKVRSVLGQIPRALNSEAARITAGGLRAGEARAKAEAPVDTGFLRSSIGVVMTSQTSGALVARANYAGYVNFGTRRMAARPFMSAGAKAIEDYVRSQWDGVGPRLPHL